MTMKIKIIKWLYYKTRKLLLAHIKSEHGTVLRCSNCDTWSHELELEGKTIELSDLKDRSGESVGYSTICGKCKHVSHWNAILAPIALPADEYGTPLQ